MVSAVCAENVRNHARSDSSPCLTGLRYQRDARDAEYARHAVRKKLLKLFPHENLKKILKIISGASGRRCDRVHIFAKKNCIIFIVDYI